MQNNINITLTPAQLQAVDEALTALENAIANLPSLTPDDKNGMVKAPQDSRDWMNNMLAHAQQNLQHLPRDFDPTLVQTDLNLVDELEPRRLRLQREGDKMDSAIFEANSDVFADLLEVRRRLNDANVAGVDSNLSEGMQRFFNRPKRAKTTPSGGGH